jgi:hypothetical protein
MRKKMLFAVACTALMVTGLEAKHDREDDCRHDRHYRGHYRDDDRDEHGHGREGLPPGLAKRGGQLPPGLERQLVRRGHLPPGLEGRFVPVPYSVCRRLPPLPEGARRGYIGGHVVVYNPRTSVILDVFGGIAIGH